MDTETARSLIRADALAASGRFLESLTEITGAYELGIKVFNKK